MTRYTHGRAEPVLRGHRQRTAENSARYLLPRLRPGQDLLDVGSGPGTITADLAERVPPDLSKLHWPLMNTPERRENVVALFHDQAHTLDRFPLQQAYLRQHQPPTLIVWGPQDGYMPAGAARAYLRDLPKAELHLFDGGHWLLETHLPEVVPILRDFLARHAR